MATKQMTKQKTHNPKAKKSAARDANEKQAETTSTEKAVADATAEENVETAHSSIAHAPGDSGPEAATSSSTRASEAHTLAELVASYLAHMEAVGKSSTTAFAYKMELDGVLAELGGDTLLTELTTNQVQYYFECPRVMRTKTGGIKAQPTILKSRRVLRLALAHAVELGWISSAPIPKQYAVAVS